MLRSERLIEILKELRKAIPLDASAVVTRDGILMASDIPDNVHGETFAIMSATMLGAAITANSELRKGAPKKIVVESDDGKTIVAGAGTNSLLVISTKQTVDEGKLLEAIDSAVMKIREVD